MNKIELLEIIKKGEDSFTEFKEEKAHPDDLAARIVAFANTEGGNLITSREQLMRLFEASKSIYYDELAVPNTSIEDIDLKYVERFIKKSFGCGIGDFGIRTDDLLKNMKILTPYERDMVTTIGGLLFFGKHPEYQFPYCKITIVRFYGNDIGETFDKKDIEGILIEQIERTERILKDYLRAETKIEGFKKEEPRFEIPIEALREAVINAIAHRNYQLPSQNRIFIFDNRIEIKSPGKLPNSVTIDNIKLGFPLHRNPLIVSLLAKEHRMTEIGTGIPRMIRLVKEQTGKEPDFEEREQEFIIRIWRPDSG